MSMSNDLNVLLLSTIVVLLSVGIMTFIWIVYYNREKKDRKHNIIRQINDQQDKIISFRLNHPELLNLGNQWSSDKLQRVYQQHSEEDLTWAKYYTFVELCVTFCNTVLYAKNKGLLDNQSFKQQYEPVIKLILNENKAIIDDLIKDNRLVSDNFKEFKL